MRKQLWIVIACGAVAWGACGAKHDGEATAPDAASAASGDCTQNTDCPSGEFCSANKTCIDTGLCKLDPDCPQGMTCGSDGTCAPGGCGGTHLDLSYVAPNFIIALDRSCSMTQVLSGTTTKWDAAVAALDHVLDVHADDIRWGATLFPDTTGDACAQDAIPYPVGDGNGPAISTLLQDALATSDPLYPDGPCVTNIDTGVEQAATDPALADSTRDSFVMLVTDGAQSKCSIGGGADGATAAIADLNTTRGIKTFVVGFGSDVNAAQLTKFANAGGEALTGSAAYYQADTADALDAAFQTIAGIAVSCQYTVAPAPTNLDETYVYFSGTELIPRDTGHMDGWDYDVSTMVLRLYGDDCQRLKSRVVTQVDVIFGCPTPPIQ